jgi:hypothetical protein
MKVSKHDNSLKQKKDNSPDETLMVEPEGAPELKMPEVADSPRDAPKPEDTDGNVSEEVEGGGGYPYPP